MFQTFQKIIKNFPFVYMIGGNKESTMIENQYLLKLDSF